MQSSQNDAPEIKESTKRGVMEQSFYSSLLQKTLSLKVSSKLVKMAFEIRLSVWGLPCKNLASRIRLSSSVKEMKYKLIRTPQLKTYT